MQQETGEYRYEILNSVLGVNAVEWEQLVGSQKDLAMSQNLLHLMESSLADQATFWTVIFRDKQSQLVACASLCVFRVDVVQTAPVFLQKCLKHLRSIWPNALQGKVLFCGLPIPPGHSHLRFLMGTDPTPILILLDQAMQKIAQQQGAHLITFKEFDEEESNQLGSTLIQLGYYRGELDPLYTLPGSFKNFKEYLSALRSSYRHQIRTNIKRFASAGLTIEHISDPQEIQARFTNALYQLYLNTWEQAEEKLECLSLQFFQELALAMPTQVLLTIVSKENQPIGFAIGLISDQNYYNLYVGMDYSIKDEVDLYFNLFYNELDCTFCLQKKQIFLGQTSDDFKLRLGAIPNPRFFYVRALNPVIKLVFALFYKLIFPKLPAYKQKNVFKN